MYLDESDFEFDATGDRASSDCPSYVCDHCGEEVELSLEASEGLRQRFVQDCPIC